MVTMANPQHVEFLRKGVDSWNRWRAEHPNVVPDLSGEDLRRLDLLFADLRNTNLCKARLAGALLVEADLSEANLAGANLGQETVRKTITDLDTDRSAWAIHEVIDGANLREADLTGVNLTNARLHGVDFTSAKLDGADFTNADIADTRFINTDLTKARIHHCRHYGPSTVDPRTLRYWKRMPVAFLRGCGFAEWEIEAAKLYHAAAPAEVIDIVYKIAELRMSLPVTFYSCFISYNHRDKAFARKLHDSLQNRGIRCWLDEKQLRPGDDIYEHVDRGIRKWDKFLLCCSEHSLNPTSWVDKEIITALEKEVQLTRERGEKIRTVIPLNLDGYLFSDQWKSGYRAEIRRRLAADFTGWEKDGVKFDAEVENVIDALRADENAREIPPTSRL